MAMSKQQQQQVVLGLMLAGGFFYVYWNYMLKPANDKIAGLEKNVSEVLAKVETMKRTANRLPALQKEYDNLLVEVGQTEKRLPKEKNLEEVLRIVTEQALKHQISVISFAPGGEKPQNYFTEVPITLNVAAPFHMLGKFLTILGQQERILSARDLRLSYSPNPKKGHTVTGTFSLMAFTFRG